MSPVAGSKGSAVNHGTEGATLQHASRRLEVGIRRNLFKLYWSARHIIAPRLRFSQDLYGDILKLNVSPDTVWLDLGCGRHVLPCWRSQEEKVLVQGCKQIVGIDSDLASLKDHQHIGLKVRGGIADLPFRDSYFNLVTANMVVEHLESPEWQFKEVGRILKPGGLFIFHTPNAFGYPTIANTLVPETLKATLIYVLEGRRRIDIFKTHYKANSRRKINELARASGFEVDQVKMLVTDAVFTMVLPVAIAELVWIRLLMTRPLRSLRTNIIAILRKGTSSGTRRSPRMNEH